MNKHLSREELMHAARGKDSACFQHLSECRECRDTVSLLKAYYVAGCTLLSDAPKTVVDRAIKIASGAQQKEKLSTMVAKLIFDSWTEPLPIGVRGEALVAERRLRFETEGIVLDLRAEQHSGKWSFVAVIVISLPEASAPLLKVGRRTIRPDNAGMFHWESVHPPRALMILLNGLTAVTLPELSWRRKLSK